MQSGADYLFVDEFDINPLMVSDKTGEPIAVDTHIKMRLAEFKA